MALALAVLAAAPASAAANGDPASDVLRDELVFVPADATDADMTSSLRATVTRAQAAGYAVKVAVIAAPPDLGRVPRYFNRPQQYAEFLADELVLLYGADARTRVLVAMPRGFGIAGLPFSRAERAAARAAAVGGSDAGELTKAATYAVEDLAAAAGSSIGSSRPEEEDSTGLFVGLAIVGGLVLAALAAALALWRRREEPDGELAPPGPGDTGEIPAAWLEPGEEDPTGAVARDPDASK